jgi:rhamnose utilization protein RhaD (predicted bifunctional aldolase and dehydrogenase)/NAD(P)-dependent dehydrogenase (short-subunit alcohol dehydrogenase family)
MKSRWNDRDATAFKGDLEQRVYTSRLLGAETSLVLHGGGNTSVKRSVTNLFGEEEEILFVKGSGWDLETIEVAGFSPCRMDHLLRLARLPALSDAEMAVELKKSLINPSAPMPSVEAILHAIIPEKFVDHTHADALLSVTNAPRGEARVREIFGGRVILLPYVMPGFKLARQCEQQFKVLAGPQTIGMLLMSHGLFTFGETAQIAYQRMIELVTLAEEYLAEHSAWSLPSASQPSKDDPAALPGPEATRVDIAALRKATSEAAGGPMILNVDCSEPVLSFARRSDVVTVSQQGPATPDHVIRTKRVPLIGRDVEAYVAAYRQYFAEHGAATLTMLDPAPRVILDRALGLCSVGRSAKDASIVADIYRHTIEVIERATALGGWHALPARDIFEVEYWDLEQAKLRKGGQPPMFTGEVALVTGAASGIGKACVASFLSRGAAVVGLDRATTVAELHHRKDYLGLVADVTHEPQVNGALDEAVRAFGGLDLLILNAGIFPSSCPIANLTTETWRQVMAVNVDANFELLRACYPLLKLAPRGGRVVVVGSKNVPAPGPGASAYSSSKAAINQLARVAALEWGKDGIRVNSLHPNMVFDTGLWTPEVLESRARHYGVSVEDYKTNNVLHVEVTSRDVAELAAELCGPLFAKTTGAQVPIDGGNDRVI